MVRTKTFILGAIALVALSLLSEPGYSLERRKKKHAKDTTEVSKPDAYGDLVKKAKITEGMVKILTVENDYYFEVDRKSTRLNSSHMSESRMPSSA